MTTKKIQELCIRCKHCEQRIIIHDDYSCPKWCPDELGGCKNFNSKQMFIDNFIEESSNFLKNN